jgi:hypothetical protein
MKRLTLNYYTDPGHGWLAVDRADLDALGIADQISAYSYQRAARAYLEEDCDMTTFMNAADRAGWKVNIREHYADRSSIRDFDHYRKATP